MCFSATASFSVSAVLLGGGIYTTVRSAKYDRSMLLFAAYPLAFGIQQAMEGFVWLRLEAQATSNNAALGFLFFSHFFWLAWVPLSAWWLETMRGTPGRSQILAAFALTGLLAGILLYVPLWQHTLFAPQVEAGNICYNTTVVFDAIFPEFVTRIIYAAIVLGSLLLSSVRAAQLLGALLSFSAATAMMGYPKESFISVWCFFAAVISLYIVAWIGRGRRIATPVRA